ncbi:capsule assembly Wzi family protein [Geobacter benzoatilyticus]|uniref:Capsule assembly Wzi family protein n=1 Tax=Geobacter benzoatilyticus TaxID=2815309 RepID=A0ABX7Q0E1_9BACT|nr:capsule assembly Wzi family protein [Geobacter benzoatilyticus]QSV44863.1 capsule assembly Wzi family protein [Geobacter benzoatilyticus]
MVKIGSILVFLVFALFGVTGRCWALASNNIPLDSPIYQYLDKLAGFDLIDTDIRGLKPYSKAEAARLLLEAESNLARKEEVIPPFAFDLIKRVRELIPREASLKKDGAAPLFDYNLFSAARLRYIYLDGEPRSYNRPAWDRSHQSAFGFIGGDLRDQPGGVVHHYGTEGTPLMENNEGVTYGDGNSAEFRWSMEGFVSDTISFLVEPQVLTTPGGNGGDRENDLDLQKGYLKIGSGGLELEVGRDENWFGPGRRGAVTLTNNAKNFDIVKLSSPEPIDVPWIKEHLGQVKYSLIFSRFDETGAGEDRRQPYFIGMKLAVKPNSWFEIGGNFVRQEGGPGHSNKDTSLKDFIFGGGNTDVSNTIAGIDLRFRLPWLRNTEIYGEYAGEDSASFWPFIESYVAGIYIPRLTTDGKNDLLFEFFYGTPILYTDHNYPVTGYTYHGMTVGHSQGGAAIEFYLRYSHWFSVRNNLALEFIRTDRGHEGRVTVDADGRFDPNGVMQAIEKKHAGRVSWTLPLYGDVDMNLLYGIEKIKNVDLVAGDDRTNQLFKMELRYRY